MTAPTSESGRLQAYTCREMSESNPLTALSGYAALYASTRAGTAVSPEAEVVRRSQCALVESAERSIAWFGAKAATISEIWGLVADCATSNWDGDGAKPVSADAATRAAAFIRALPDPLPLPEVAPEPDGSLSLDWIESRVRLLSISIGTADRVAYAWLDGSDCGHGVARFDGWLVPVQILQQIRRMVTLEAHPSRTRPRSPGQFE